MIPKFRAWHKELKTMFEVKSLVFTLNLATIASKNDLFPSRTCSFDDIVLMQSTGLFDKNGVEIFEGDVVVNQYGNVGYIAYLKQEAGFVVVLKKSDYRLGHRNTGESYDVTNNHIIIGNIYQNPELVEVQE